jgi:outer membrane protein
MQSKSRLIALLALCGVLHTVQAENLIEAYQDALSNDPIFKQAEAQYLAIRQNYPISLSATLPALVFVGTTGQSRLIDNQTNFTIPESDGAHNYTLEVTQPVFNLKSWLAVRNASDVIKSAEANYYAAAQDLMIRTANAYFTVLANQDALRFTEAEVKANKRQLDQAKQRYDVGLDAITTVYNAQAAYDTISADKIQAQNRVDNSIEALHEITSKRYRKFSKLNTEKLQLKSPQPNQIDPWVRTALKQNYNVLAAKYSVAAAKNNVNINQAGHFPTATAYANYNDNKTPGFISSSTGNVGMRINFPLFQSGLVTSQIRQAQYSAMQTQEQLRSAQLNTETVTRQIYNDIVSGISVIKANRTSAISVQRSLDSTDAAFRAGTRTIIEVLQQVRDLYNVQQRLANTQYLYIVNSLRLKQAAGSLSMSDLQQVNTWLD